MFHPRFGFQFKAGLPTKGKKCNLSLIGKEKIVPGVSKSASGKWKFPCLQRQGVATR